MYIKIIKIKFQWCPSRTQSNREIDKEDKKKFSVFSYT